MEHFYLKLFEGDLVLRVGTTVDHKPVELEATEWTWERVEL